LIYQD